MVSKRTNWLRRATFWGLVAYWMALLAATHWPRAVMIFGGGGIDKVVHFIAYAGLAALVAVECWWRGQTGAPAYLAIFTTLAAFAALDELTQPLMNRSADRLDWYADLAGIAVGLGLARLVTWGRQVGS